MKDTSAFVLENDRPKSEEPSELLPRLTWWNELHDAGLVSTAAKPGKPNKAVLAAWKKSQRDPEARAALADRDVLRRAIEGASFVQSAGWFSLAKLFGGKNQVGELIAQKLLDGGFSDGSKNGSVGGTVRQTRSVARVSQRYGQQRPAPPGDALSA